MNRGDAIAGMAGDTKCGGRYRGGMAVGMTVEIGCMTATAGGASSNGGDLGSIDDLFQLRWRGVAIGATAVVHCHRAVGGMAQGYTRWVIQDN